MRKKDKFKFFRLFKNIKVLFLLFIVLIIFVTIFQISKMQDLRQRAQVPNQFVASLNGNLYLNDKPFKFTGFNVYQLATYWGKNRGCGGMLTDTELETFFSSLKPNTVVRFWAFQSQAYNTNTGQLDFFGIDRVVTVAGKHNIKLIPVLGNFWSDCDGKKKDVNWFTNDYKDVINSSEGPLSYLNYVKQIVQRYKDSSSIAIWEPINEPEVRTSDFSSCALDASLVLRNFFDDVGRQIKLIDPNHLISSGVIGTGQCGASYKEYQYLHESPWIDVGSYHDYDADDEPLPGDQWNGLQIRIDQMKSISKPLIVGEAGILANDNVLNCLSTNLRKEKIKAKMDTQFGSGISGFLVWNYVTENSNSCNYDLGIADSLFELVNNYQEILNPSPTGLSCSKVADINCDGSVGIVDLSILLSSWNLTSSNADLNHDGKVGITDLSILLSNWEF